MKSLLQIAVLIFALSTSTLFATEREFRINKNSATKNGYAIGWGIPGEKLDFEALDMKTDDEIQQFITTSNVVNYLIDLHTDSILYIIKSQGLDYTIGNIHVGNFFALSLAPILFDNLDFEQEAVALIENWKWDNQITNLFIFDRSQGIKTILNLNEGQFDKLVKTEIAKNLKDPELDLFTNGATVMTQIKGDVLNNAGNVSIFSLNSSTPKTDGPELDLEATIQFTLENESVLVKLISLKSKIGSNVQ
ncbi:MAG: hypothetical protein PHY93_00355 [Bacteriovorax sp.]|nr:hypothetical protein [Bacteriovorax sp.]